jgi:hypothetical protein
MCTRIFNILDLKRVSPAYLHISFHLAFRGRFASDPAVPIFNGFTIQFKGIVVPGRKRSAKFSTAQPFDQQIFDYVFSA